MLGAYIACFIISFHGAFLQSRLHTLSGFYYYVLSNTFTKTLCKVTVQPFVKNKGFAFLNKTNLSAISLGMQNQPPTGGTYQFHIHGEYIIYYYQFCEKFKKKACGNEFHNVGDSVKNEYLNVSMLQKCSLMANMCLYLICSWYHDNCE